jgi:hypothetical protein
MMTGLAQADVVAPAPVATAPTQVEKAVSAIPYKHEKSGTDALAYRSLASLVLVAIVGYGIVLGLKRLGGHGTGSGRLLRGNRRLHQVEAMRISRQSSLHVVNYDGDELLLADGPQGVQLLSRRPIAQGKGPSSLTEANPTQEQAL